jgi:hypothetical protein
MPFDSTTMALANIRNNNLFSLGLAYNFGIELFYFEL